MDWSRVRRNRPEDLRPAGAYANLEELIRLQFEARDFSFLPRQPVTSVLSGRYASRLRGRGLNFEELRRYQPGDDVRTIDWKVTARTRSAHVRVYTEEKDRAVLFLVDQRLHMFFGSRDRFKSVTAARLAALGAWRALRVGDRVGAMVFNDSEIIEVRPQRRQATVMRILHEVLRLNHALSAGSESKPDASRLNRVLDKASRLAPHDVLVVLISDFFGVDEQTDRLLARLAAHNDVLGVLVHDPLRDQLPDRPMIVSDGRLQMRLGLADPDVRSRLLDDFRQEQDRITGFLRKLSAPLLAVSNQGDLVAQVRRLLGVPGRSGV